VFICQIVHHPYQHSYREETLQSQTDRATRCVSRNLLIKINSPKIGQSRIFLSKIIERIVKSRPNDLDRQRSSVIVRLFKQYFRTVSYALVFQRQQREVRLQYSETSINCIFMFHFYFVSIDYSSLDVFYIINFMFILHFIPCCMCVCHMCIKVPTYLLAISQ